MKASEREAQLVTLVREYNHRVLGIAIKYAGADEAEDLTQEIWTQVFKALPSFKSRSPVEPWLLAVSFNVARKWSRSRSRWRRFRESALRHFKVEAEMGPGDPVFEEHRVTKRIWNAVESLPQLQRAVVLLRFGEGFSTSETAIAVSRTEGTVKQSLHRAVRKLRVELGDLEDFWISEEL